MGERSRLAFQMRFLGPALFRKNPSRLLSLGRRALRCGAIRPRDAVLLALKLALPAAAYASLKRRLRR